MIIHFLFEKIANGVTLHFVRKTEAMKYYAYFGNENKRYAIILQIQYCMSALIVQNVLGLAVKAQNKYYDISRNVIY